MRKQQTKENYVVVVLATNEWSWPTDNKSKNQLAIPVKMHKELYKIIFLTSDLGSLTYSHRLRQDLPYQLSLREDHSSATTKNYPGDKINQARSTTAVTSELQNLIDKMSSTKKPFWGKLVCPILPPNPFMRTVLHRVGGCASWSHLTKISACQPIFQGVACLCTRTQKKQSKTSLYSSLHGTGWVEKGGGSKQIRERSDFLFRKQPYVLIPAWCPLETSTVHVNFGQARRKRGGWLRWRTKLARLDRWGMCGVGRVKSEEAPSAASSVVQAGCWPLLGSSRENGHKVELWLLSISEQLITRRCPECPAHSLKQTSRVPLEKLYFQSISNHLFLSF